jgi:radical SAM protein with 4Fe4S-binding SPASM domain
MSYGGVNPDGTVSPTMSKGYMRRFSAVLQGVFRFAVIPKRFVTFNPMQYVKLRGRKDDTDIFSEDESDAVSTATISYDQYTKLTDWLRNRKGAEEDALRAIKLCVDNGFRVKAQTNVHRKNIESMLHTARLLDEMGVYEMRIIRTTEVPRWNENAKGATLDLDEYFAGMLDFVREYISEDHKMVIDIWQLMTLFPRSKSYNLRTVACCDGEYKPTRPVCPGNRSMVAVSANGNVFPCMQMSGYYEARNDILGNVKEYGLQPLLQMGKYLAEVCATVGELAEVNEECRNCPYFKYCAAGCRAVALTLTGDKMGVDLSKCLFFKKGYYEKVVRTMGVWRNNTPINV